MRILIITTMLFSLLFASVAFCNPDTEEAIPQEFELKTNPSVRLSSNTRISNNTQTAYMTIYSGLSVIDVKGLWQDLKYLEAETTIRRVNMFINSPGGSAFAGLALSDLIIHAQDDLGFTFVAEASGIIASAAVPVFAVCKERLAMAGTIFMVHEAAIFKWPGRETRSDIISQACMMELLQKQYLSYLVDNSNLSEDQWKEKEGKTSWFGVSDARKWGLLERNTPRESKDLR